MDTIDMPDGWQFEAVRRWNVPPSHDLTELFDCTMISPNGVRVSGWVSLQYYKGVKQYRYSLVEARFSKALSSFRLPVELERKLWYALEYTAQMTIPELNNSEAETEQ